MCRWASVYCLSVQLISLTSWSAVAAGIGKVVVFLVNKKALISSGESFGEDRIW